MYQAELTAFLPVTNQKVNIVACCRSINGYDVVGLTLRFFDENDVLLDIEYDKHFFEDIEHEANNALLEEYYNNTLSYMN